MPISIFNGIGKALCVWNQVLSFIFITYQLKLLNNDFSQMYTKDFNNVQITSSYKDSLSY